MRASRLAAYPFQKYRLLTKTVAKIIADASKATRVASQGMCDAASAQGVGAIHIPLSIYKTRIRLKDAVLIDPYNNHHQKDQTWK